MPIESVPIAPVTAAGTAALRLLGSCARLRIEASAKLEVGERHVVVIDARIFNIGKPITIRRIGLIEAPSLVARICGRYSIVDEVQEVELVLSRHGASERRPVLPAHIPAGDFASFTLRTTKVSRPSHASTMRFAVWHAFSGRPKLGTIAPISTLIYWRRDVAGGSYRELRSISELSELDAKALGLTD